MHAGYFISGGIKAFHMVSAALPTKLVQFFYLPSDYAASLIANAWPSHVLNLKRICADLLGSINWLVRPLHMFASIPSEMGSYEYDLLRRRGGVNVWLPLFHLP